MDTKELRELLARATPGPWTARKHGVIVGGAFHEYTNGSAQSQIASFTVVAHSDAPDSVAERDANTTLAVAAVNALPALLDSHAAMAAEVEALRAENARLEANQRVSGDYVSEQLKARAESAEARCEGLEATLRELEAKYRTRHANWSKSAGYSGYSQGHAKQAEDIANDLAKLAATRTTGGE